MQFGVTKALIGDFVRHDEPHPAEPDVVTPWYSLDYVYRMEAGEAVLRAYALTGEDAARVLFRLLQDFAYALEDESATEPLWVRRHDEYGEV